MFLKIIFLSGIIILLKISFSYTLLAYILKELIKKIIILDIHINQNIIYILAGI